MEPSGSESGARSLEEAFFARENTELLEDLRSKAEREEKRRALRAVVQIEDEPFLDRLIALDIGPQTVLALRLIPLVFVAWADGKIDDEEREAILKASKKEGVTTDDTTSRLLGEWLTQPPDAGLLGLWKEYVGRIWNHFTPDEQWRLRERMLDSARGVAQAAGGFLGLAKISAAEQAVLDDLRTVLE